MKAGARSWTPLPGGIKAHGQNERGPFVDARCRGGVLLRIVWALIGFFAPFFGLSMGRRSVIFPLHQHDGRFLLYVCMAGAILGALLGPLLYVPKFQEGAGTLEEVKRMSGRTGFMRDRK